MLIYKQRYKPRTSRAFTKSDLTVYDSAGNTALNALTVFGKSEVVDGSIKSAGEGYAVVRLADLTWEYVSTADYNVFRGAIANIKQPQTYPERLTGMLCSKYSISTNASYAGMGEKSILKNGSFIIIKDTNYTTVSDFVASLGDTTLAYEEATPTNNTIAVKTDNGTGINGTMAVFTTGTPLRGIPDSEVRDVMAWDGSSGEVTKVCGEVDLGTLTWERSNNGLFLTTITSMKPATTTEQRIQGLCCARYPLSSSGTSWDNLENKHMQKVGQIFGVKDLDYTTATDFKTAMSGVKLVYELVTPTTEQLTTAENDSIAGLRTFTPQTHAQNNAGAEMTVDYTIRVPTN